MSSLLHSPSTPLDHETVEAIKVLTDAVRRERVPGVVEFGQLERALEQAARQATEEHLAEAASAFHALDGDFQTRIVSRAQTLAHTVVEQRRAPAAAAPESPVPLPAPAPAPKSAVPRSSRVQGASPFLAALNQNRSRG
jgi:hypothetical protein